MTRHITTPTSTSTALVSGEPVEPPTAEERERIAEIRRTVVRDEDGAPRLPLALMPHGSERRRMVDIHRDLHSRLQPATRKQVHDRVHTFLMGFPALRTADGALAAVMVQDFVEAVEGYPIEAVHRACKGWNRRVFTWPNYSFPPNPPELNRAVREMLVDAKVEHYDLGLILLAKPTEPKLIVTEEQRQKCIAQAKKVIDAISATNVLEEEDPREAFGTTNRLFQAREDAALAQHGIEVPRMGKMRVSLELAMRIGLEVSTSQEFTGEGGQA